MAITLQEIKSKALAAGYNVDEGEEITARDRVILPGYLLYEEGVPTTAGQTLVPFVIEKAMEDASPATFVPPYVYKAILHDTENKVQDSDIVKNYSISARQLEGTNNIDVTIYGTDLQKHKNQGSTEGHWIGFAIVPPYEDVTKYKFASTKEGLGSASATDLEDNVYQDKKGFALYFNHKDTDTFKEVFVQFLKGDTEILATYKFTVNLSYVKNKAEEVIALNSMPKVALGEDDEENE